MRLFFNCTLRKKTVTLTEWERGMVHGALFALDPSGSCGSHTDTPDEFAMELASQSILERLLYLLVGVFAFDVLNPSVEDADV